MGIIALAVVLLLLVAVNAFLPALVPRKTYTFSQKEVSLPVEEKQTIADAITPLEPGHAKATLQAKPIQIVELNTADSTTLLELKGIGPVFAGRIIKYRNLLGGFVKKEQLLEVYGFDNERYEFIKPYVSVNGKVAQLNLNTSTFKELNKHPYIEYNLTKAIFNLKKKLKTFNSVEDIKQIDLVTEELYTKIAPYLTVQ